MRARNSILEVPIDWQEDLYNPSESSSMVPEPSSSPPITPKHKLKKKVAFSSSPDTPSSQIPETPDSSHKRGFKSFFQKFHKPSELVIANPSTPSEGGDSDTSWHHHDSYFPEYEPMFPSTSSTDKWVSPFESMLTPEEIRKQHHAAVLGQAIAVHYPDLPSWSDYTSKVLGGGTDKAKAGWQSGKWGTEGWTGYGWEGEKLPTDEGVTFGQPMPKGVVIEPPKEETGKKKKKKKKKGGGGGGQQAQQGQGGADDGDDDEEGGDDGDE